MAVLRILYLPSRLIDEGSDMKSGWSTGKCYLLWVLDVLTHVRAL